MLFDSCVSMDAIDKNLVQERCNVILNLKIERIRLLASVNVLTDCIII